MRKATILLAVLVLPFAGVGALIRSLAPASLIERSRLVLPADANFVRWITVNEFEYLRWNADSKASSYYVRNIQTGNERYSRRVVDGDIIRSNLGERAGKVSPDLRWKLSLMFGDKADHFSLSANFARLKEVWTSAHIARASVWPPWRPTFAWSSASNAWAFLEYVNTGWRLRTFDLSTRAQTQNIDLRILGNGQLHNLAVLGFLDRARVVIARSTAHFPDYVFLREFIVLDTRTSRVVEKVAFSPPAGTRREEDKIEKVAVEPGGGKIAWILERKIPPPAWRSWFRKLIPSLPLGDAGEVQEIWTTSLDGKGWHLIGRMPLSQSDTRLIGSMPNWTPDGRAILFRTRDGLRVIHI